MFLFFFFLFLHNPCEPILCSTHGSGGLGFLVHETLYYLEREHVSQFSLLSYRFANDIEDIAKMKKKKEIHVEGSVARAEIGPGPTRTSSSLLTRSFIVAPLALSNWDERATGPRLFAAQMDLIFRTLAGLRVGFVTLPGRCSAGLERCRLFIGLSRLPTALRRRCVSLSFQQI